MLVTTQKPSLFYVADDIDYFDQGMMIGTSHTLLAQDMVYEDQINQLRESCGVAPKTPNPIGFIWNVV